MNKTNIIELIKSMKIINYVVINQNTKNINCPADNIGTNGMYLTLNEKGLSKSRNKAIKYSEADVCVIADDDMYYVNDYEKIIKNAYDQYPEADIIAFNIVSKDSQHKREIFKSGKLYKLQTMKLCSVQLTLKRASIINNGLLFDESFGAGSVKYFGEENIFLFDCARKGLNIYYVPDKLATLLPNSESSWFNGHTKENYVVGGSIYYRMSPLLCPLLIIQFALRKRHMFGNDLKTIQVIKYMTQGAIKQAKL